MAITHIGVGAQAEESTNGATITAAWPAGYTAVADDYAIVVAGGKQNNGSSLAPTAPTPATYTQLSTQFRNTGTYDLQGTAWGKKLAAAEAAAAMAVLLAYASASGGITLQTAVFRGVDLTTPLDIAVTGSSTGAAATFTPPSVTPVTNGAWVISIVVTSDDNALDMSADQGFTAIMSGASYDTTLGGDHSIGVAYKEIPTAGSVTLPTWRQNTNAGAGSEDEWVYITVVLRPAASGSAPTFTSGTMPATGSLNVAYVGHTFTASGSPAPTFAVQTGALPTGLSLDSTTGVLSGTPTVSGVYNFTVRATNTAGTTDTSGLTITVTGSVPAFTSGTVPPTAGLRRAYVGHTFTASGSPAPTFAVQTGSLPTGLSLAANGVLSGTAVEPGTYTFTVRATNTAGTADTGSTVIDVPREGFLGLWAT